jgi:hypothetical protein
MGIVLLGLGCADFHGEYQPFGLIVIAIGACLLLVTPTGLKRSDSTIIWSVAVFLGAISTGIVFGAAPKSWLLPVVGGAAAVLVVASGRTRLRVVGCLVAGSTSLVALLQPLRWGHASIDVFDFTQRLTLRLLQGKDPYSVAYPTTTPHLPLAHYFFGPAVLILSIPGRLLGDVRVSNLLAVVALIVAVTLLAKRHGGGQQAWRCLALCLTLPFFPLMIFQAWAEIYLMAAIALWVLLRDRHRASSVAILAVGMATIPTALPLLVLPFLWWRRARVEIFAAALLAVAICLPFALWSGPANFLSYTVGVNLHLPPRPDGLDLDSAWVRLTGSWLPGWIWPAVVGISLVLVARAHPHSWTKAFYLGSAFLVIAFLFAKWAFFNYYFLVAMGVILGVALQQFSAVAPGALEDAVRIAHPSDQVAVAAGTMGP